MLYEVRFEIFSGSIPFPHKAIMAKDSRSLTVTLPSLSWSRTRSYDLMSLLEGLNAGYMDDYGC